MLPCTLFCPSRYLMWSQSSSSIHQAIWGIKSWVCSLSQTIIILQMCLDVHEWKVEIWSQIFPTHDWMGVMIKHRGCRRNPYEHVWIFWRELDQLWWIYTGLTREGKRELFRGREYSSSKGDTGSVTEGGIYNNGEPWGYNAFFLSQIIWGNSDGLLSPSRPILHAFSLYGYVQVHGNCVVWPKPEFYQAKE